MRVIAGTLGGRQFESPGSLRTHPMSDKIRGALFNILGDISGLTLLDPFAGSSAISIEAVSRGVVKAVAIDRDKQAYKTVQKNVEALSLSASIEVVHGNAVSWSNGHKNTTFDIVVLDPPFDKVLYTSLIKLSSHVASTGTLVLSLPADENGLKIPGFNEVSNKSYGDARLVFYKRA